MDFKVLQTNYISNIINIATIIPFGKSTTIIIATPKIDWGYGSLGHLTQKNFKIFWWVQ